MRRLTMWAAAVALALGFFGWGFLAHRDQLPPYRWVRALALSFGLTEEGAQAALSRSAEFTDLLDLPYISGTVDERGAAEGVVAIDPDRVFDGLNFFASTAGSEAFLMDMRGRILHEWHAEEGTWEFAHLLPTGEILALDFHARVAKLSPESELLWEVEGEFHHDLWVEGDGDIYLLERRPRSIAFLHPGYRVLDEEIVVLSQAGVEKERISLLDILMGSSYRFLLPSLNDVQFEGTRAAASGIDILHANHIEVFDGSVEQRSPLFKAGNLMVSVRNINAVIIIDRESFEIEWLWGPSNVTAQHHPSLLDNGNILLFDNGLARSEVLEVDPITMQVAWRFARDGFFTQTRGSCQRLPNGNTLITESNSGYVFEVTPDHEEVWRYANPTMTPDGARAALFRMTRLSAQGLGFKPVRRYRR